MMFAPVLMEEEYWANSYFSVARYSGGIKLGGSEYFVVNKQGQTLLEISVQMDKEGRDGKAIEPGEPADLIKADFIPFYKKLGRDKFIDVLKNNQTTSDKELKKIYAALM